MNDYYDYYTYSSPPTFNPLPTIISLVLCVFVLVCMWIVFRKAGKPGWAAIVPFYNLYVLCCLISPGAAVCASCCC